MCSLREGVRVSDTGGGEGSRARAALGELGRRLARRRAPARRLRHAARRAPLTRTPVRVRAAPVSPFPPVTRNDFRLDELEWTINGRVPRFEVAPPYTRKPTRDSGINYCTCFFFIKIIYLRVK